MNFRIQQRVCRVSWRKGYPFIQFATVIKVMKRTFSVELYGIKQSGVGWYAHVGEALESEFRELLSAFAPIGGWALKDEYFTTGRVVVMVCRLNRLLHKIAKVKAGHK